MARKNKSLANAFNQFHEPELEKDISNNNTVTFNETKKKKQNSKQEKTDGMNIQKSEGIQSDETRNSNTKSITEDVIQERNIETEASYGHLNNNREASSKTIRDVTNSIMSMYDEKSKKKTVEETHNRATFLFRKDLQERLDKLADGKRGFKTMFMNKAIEALLDEMESMEK